MHMKYKDCGLTLGLAEELLSSMRYSRIKAKYAQHRTTLNRNEINSKIREISLVFSYIVLKEDNKDKSSGFSRPLHSVF